jgi:undecaprenyl-diphosphatase
VREVLAVITHYGLSGWVLIPSLIGALLAAILALTFRPGMARRGLAELAQVFAFVFVGVGFPGLAVAIGKRLLGRARPELMDSVGSWGFESFFNDHSYQSFPSGHTTTAFAMAFTVGFLERRAFPPLLIMAVMVGVSRVVLGAHYPTDVLGGAVAGMLLAYGTRNFFAARRWLFRIHPDGTVSRRRLAALRRLVHRAAR